MAGCTTDAAVDVDAVVEIDKIGGIVDADPLQGDSGAEAFAHWFEHGGVFPDLGVAIHAGFGGGDTRERRIFDGRMAIPAIDSQLLYVVLVTEGYGLFNRLPDTGDVRRTEEQVPRAQGTEQKKDTPEDANLRQGIRTGVKYLAHNPRTTSRHRATQAAVHPSPPRSFRHGEGRSVGTKTQAMQALETIVIS
jgi:hypothetical protein